MKSKRKQKKADKDTDTETETETDIEKDKDPPHTPSKGVDNPANTPKKRTSKPKPEKTQFAEFVSMTNDEYTSLVAKVGEQGARRCIEILDNYKGSSGKKYSSDYRTILNWVVTRYEEEKTKTNGGVYIGNGNGRDVGAAGTEHSKYATEF